MMIWFAGILQDTCCNKTDENKTNKKKTLSWVWCLFHNYARIDWHHVTSVRFTANTQITNFSFQVLVRRKSLFFNFLDSTLIFFLSEWKHTFLGAPSQDRTSFSPAIGLLFGCVLEGPHGSTNATWKSEGSAKCGEEICNWVVRNKKLMKNKV